MILQTKIAISVFFLSLFQMILFIIKGLLPMAFLHSLCLLAFGRNTQIISPMAHTMSSICFEVELKFSNSGSYKQYQRGGIQRNYSPLFTTQYTTQLRIWTKPLISHNALILQYFIPCFFVVFFSNITIYFTVSSCLPKQICRQLLELIYIVRSGVT